MTQHTFFVYGLQRSGTNFLTVLMRTNFGIILKNNDYNDRKNVTHKHFRIYDDKKFILVNQYQNDIIIDDYEKLEKIIEEKNLKIFVIRKDIHAWLVSIERWAKKCNWEEKNKMKYIDDYLEFYKKWESFRSDNILFIDYISLLKKDKETISAIEKFTGKKYRGKNVKNKVKCSDVFDHGKMKYYLEKEYMKEFSKEELDIIKSKMR